MEKKGLSQEGLKLTACVSMLLDHIGAVLIYPMYLDACMVNGVDLLGAAMPPEAKALYAAYRLLRIIGRLAFPIYCFLLVEGFHHTRNRKKYGFRLLAGALAAEIPFDLAFSGGIDLSGCSVMVTLLLGYFALLAMEKWPGPRSWGVVLALIAAAELIGTDYAGTGIVLVVLFELTRERPVWRLLGLVGLCWSGYGVQIGPFSVPIQAFAVAALIPIHFYAGRKRTGSRGMQLAFYLFYPVHLLMLWGISVTFV